MADGNDFQPQVTRREFDAVTAGLQRQVDAIERSMEGRLKDLREEMRRMSEAIQSGMAALSQKLERQQPPPAPPITQIVREELAQLHKTKQGTPGWVYLLIVVGGVLAFLFLRRLGLL